MRVVVLGAGVIGATSAYYLARAGHEVIVLDRQPGPALETSFANAGQISPGYSAPWAAPGIPQKALKWMLMKHAPLILHPLADLETLRWIGGLMRNCTSARYALNKSRMVRIATYSLRTMKALREETGVSYDGQSRGTLQLFRTQKQLDSIGKDVEVLRQDGVSFEVLDAGGCIAAEPGLAPSRAKFVGGLRLPGDETGDCYKFTNAICARAEALGVQFRYGTRIQGLTREGNRVRGVVTQTAEEIPMDAVLVAIGSFTPALLKPLGLKAPIYPVKGYSITMPIRDEARAPVSTIMDESYKVAITRLGGRIRVGGMAEIAGFDSALNERRRATLVHSMEDLFGGSGDFAEAHFWTGLRPMTPDGTPIIGPTQLANLYVNSGHGTLGWTMACGSAQVIADMISGRAPDIETHDLGLDRY
ncbi:MAG: D-amino acid dehydrogenase [Pseudomonadota bacterium]